jgi:hypothetical protein
VVWQLVNVGNTSGSSSMPSHSFIYHHPSPFPISEKWTFHLPFDTCSGQSDTPTCSPPTIGISILCCFLLAASLPLPTSCWLLTLCPPPPLLLFPRAIYFNLKTEVARSSETLVSYCNTTWHHNANNLGL